MFFQAIENTLIHILGTENHNLLSAITQSFIIYQELEHLKMCLDTVTDMNETLFDACIDLWYEKHFHNGVSDYDNESLYIPIVPTLYEESAIFMIADKDAVDHIPKNRPPSGRSHVCAHGAELLVLKVVQSGVHLTCGGGHAVCTPPSPF